MPENKWFVLTLLIAVLAGTAACKKIPETVVLTAEVTNEDPIVDYITMTPTPTDGDRPLNPELPAMERSVCAPLPEMPAASESAAAVPAAFRAAVPANADPIPMNGAWISPADQSGTVY